MSTVVPTPIIIKETKVETVVQQNNDIENEREGENECEISLSETIPTSDYMLPLLNANAGEEINDANNQNNNQLHTNEAIIMNNNNTTILSENTQPIVVSSSEEQPNTETSTWFSKIYDKVSSTTISLASSTSEHFSNASANISDSIRGILFSHETQESFNQINQLIDMFFKDVQFSKVDMMIGLMLLNKYYRNIAIRSGIPITDINFVEDSLRYMKFANATYGWKCVYGFGLSKSSSSNALSMLGAAVSMNDSANLRVLCEHTGIQQSDVILAKWTSTNFRPGHYVALDHEKQAIVIAIRGTFHARDCLVDLVAVNQPYLDGSVHQGMYRCAEKKLYHLTPIIMSTLSKYPAYKILVVGHSLGAGVASIFTLLFHQTHSQIPIHCYAFAPPCVLSMDLALSRVCKELITSFVLEDDIVPRLCYGNLEHLKTAVVDILSQTGGNLQRTLQWMIAPGGVMPKNLKAKLASILQVKTEIQVKFGDNLVDASMFPPGRIFHLCQENLTNADNNNNNNDSIPSSNQYVIEESNPSLFNEIIVSPTMLTDHMPHNYEKALQNCLNALKKSSTNT